MIKLIDIYLKVNFCGQKIGNKYFPYKGLVNVIGFELSFIGTGIIISLFSFTGYRNPLIGALIVGVFIAILRFGFDKKIEREINFTYLEEYYSEISLFKKRLFFIISLLIFIISFLTMVYIPKIIFMLVR